MGGCSINICSISSYFYFFSTFNFIFIILHFSLRTNFHARCTLCGQEGVAGRQRGRGRVAAVFTKRVTALFLYYGSTMEIWRRDAMRCDSLLLQELINVFFSVCVSVRSMRLGTLRG